MKAGDHIVIRGAAAPIHAIDVGDRTAIHFVPGEGPRRALLQDLARGGPVEVVTYAARVYPPRQTVARAFSRFAEGAYAAMFRDGEAFAVWCRTGQLPPSTGAVATGPQQREPSTAAPVAAPVAPPAPRAKAKPAAKPAPRAKAKPAAPRRRRKAKAKAPVKAKAPAKAKAKAGAGPRRGAPKRVATPARKAKAKPAAKPSRTTRAKRRPALRKAARPRRAARRRS